MGPAEMQLEKLRERFGDASLQHLPSGSGLVTVDRMVLPAGWNKPVTAIRFLVPAGYPFAALDCFWADADLLLADGRVPQNATAQPVPETDLTGLWFSWHLIQPWNPNRDSLSSWMNTVADRFRRLQ